MSEYTISVTKNQMRIIMNALESYFRTRMGQFFDFSCEVALNGYEYDKENPENDKLFNEYIERRNESEDLFMKAYDVAAPNRWERKKTKDMVSAIDIWHVIRHQLYIERPEPKDHFTVDAYPPHPNSDEPLITIERVETQ